MIWILCNLISELLERFFEESCLAFQPIHYVRVRIGWKNSKLFLTNVIALVGTYKWKGVLIIHVV